MDQVLVQGLADEIHITHLKKCNFTFLSLVSPDATGTLLSSAGPSLHLANHSTRFSPSRPFQQSMKTSSATLDKYAPWNVSPGSKTHLRSFLQLSSEFPTAS